MKNELLKHEMAQDLRELRQHLRVLYRPERCLADVDAVDHLEADQEMRTRADLIRDIEEAELRLKSLREKISETEKEYRSIKEFFDKLYDPKTSTEDRSGDGGLRQRCGG